MLQIYTHAGVTRINGKFKVRYTNNGFRVKKLIKEGHTDIDLLELPSALSKTEAIKYLLSINFDNGNTEVRQTLEDALDRRGEKVAPTLEAIEAKAQIKVAADKVDAV